MLLLNDARVWAPEELGTRSLLIGGGKVLALFEEPPATGGLSGEITILDLDGRFVLPGLIDAHVHITGGGGEAGYSSRVPPLSPGRFVRGGITSVVGLLGTDDVTRSPLEVLATARGLCEAGLSAWCWTGGYHVPPATITGSVRGDLVAIDRVIGLGELAISDHRSSQPTYEEFLRLAADCHVGGLMTGKAGVLHLHLGDGERGLEMVRAALEQAEVPARVFHPTHVNRRVRLFEEALEIAARGCTIDVTAFPEEPLFAGMASDEHPGATSDSEELRATAAVRRYFDSELPPERLTVSSDGGGCLPRFDAQGRVESFEVGEPAELLLLLRRLVGAGVPLHRALAPLTRNVASHLRLPGKGRIVAGADADLLIVSEDLELIGVVAGGVEWMRDGELLRQGRFE